MTRGLLALYGPGSIFILCGSVIVIACLSLVTVDPYAIIVGGMPGIALVLIMIRSLAHGMIHPARESLYTLVPRTLRFKGKNAVDTAVWRAGDVLSMASISGFRGLGVTMGGIEIIWVASCYIGMDRLAFNETSQREMIT